MKAKKAVHDGTPVSSLACNLFPLWHRSFVNIVFLARGQQVQQGSYLPDESLLTRWLACHLRSMIAEGWNEGVGKKKANPFLFWPQMTEMKSSKCWVTREGIRPRYENRCEEAKHENPLPASTVDFLNFSSCSTSSWLSDALFKKYFSV